MPLDATFWVSLLQLLVAAYQLKSVRDPKVEVLVSIQEELRVSSPADPKALIQEQLEKHLPEAEAASVQADLLAFELFVNPPQPESFDYWKLLEKLFEGLRVFCHANGVFRFRGFGKTIGDRILELRHTADAIFDPETKKQWQTVRHPSRSIELRGTKNATLYLVEQPVTPGFPYGIDIDDKTQLPVFGLVEVGYVEYNSFGGYGGPPPIQSEGHEVYLLPGSDIHWLYFQSSDRGYQARAMISYQRMLTASAVLEILNAVRDDLMQYVVDLAGDQSFSDADLKSSFKTFMESISPSASESQGS